MSYDEPKPVSLWRVLMVDTRINGGIRRAGKIPNTRVVQNHFVKRQKSQDERHNMEQYDGV